MTVTNCRSCDDPIVWVVTENGKRMPVDAEPVRVRAGFTLDEPIGDAPPLARWKRSDDRAEQLYVSHFSTCPQAREWRS